MSLRDQNDQSPIVGAVSRLATRRQFFKDCVGGLGTVALANLLSDGRALAQHSPSGLHLPPKIKNVIFLHMAGAPSQLDLFDYKPKLQELDGQLVPEEMIEGETFAFIRGRPTILGSPYSFSKYGENGQEISELLPHLQNIADDVTFVRSMQTDQFNHAPAQLFLYTGFPQPGRPSLGSWVTYGLGSENRDLPGYVVLISGNQPSGGNSCWGSGFLPADYQGVRFRSEGDPVLFVSDPPGVDRRRRRLVLDAIKDLNEMQLGAIGDPEIEARISQYELSYRMQESVPELADISREPAAIHELYGTSAAAGEASRDPLQLQFANNCLLARRLVERGVRFVQLFHWGWDSHGAGPSDDIVSSLRKRCLQCDQASAALVTDLKQRGLLDETLVVWGGEFGRTPMNEGRAGSKYLGRDHHPGAFTIWLAGGGLQSGITYGATDELGYRVTQDPVHVHDLQATILHLLGIDHEKLTYRFQGRDFRLTDVHGKVVRGLLA